MKINNTYKHTQIGYLMLVVLPTRWFFSHGFRLRPGLNLPRTIPALIFAVTAIMALILFILASFTTLSVFIDENYLRIKFGYGIFRKNSL